MQELVQVIIEKISAYDIFNNFLPGIVFCYITKRVTRFTFSDGEILERLFIYYFIGLIISRIGSLCVEKILKSIQINNKMTRTKEPFLKFAPYSDYIEASKRDSIIKELNEKNNVYRTSIVTLIAIIIVKIYDWLLYDIVKNICDGGNKIIFLVLCIIFIIVFIFSYKKQTDYIRNRVEKCINQK